LLSGLVAAGFDRYPVLPEIPDGLPTLIIQVNLILSWSICSSLLQHHSPLKMHNKVTPKPNA
jgi:hypothetical protein